MKLSKMCHCLPYKSPHCRHCWLVLAAPCAPGMSFRNAPPGHRWTRPTTFLGGTMWYPAPPGACPDCDLQGRYDGDKIRLWLGKGGKGDTAGRHGMWGPYGNGFWGGGMQASGMGGNQWGATPGYGQPGGYVPGQVAVRSFGGYGPTGGYKGRQRARYPGQPGGLLNCFGL